VNESGWVTVRVHPGSRRDAVLATLFDAGAQGVQEVDTVLVTHVRGQEVANALVCAIVAASPDARVDTEPLPDIDWSEQWKRGIRRQKLGALTVAPPWLAEGLDPARTIVIEPGMAFGTGEHATTRGVIRLLQRVVRAGDYVADLGAGSAVLAIAAAKLGARRVAAIEIDHDAIANAEGNVERNGVTDRVTVIEGDAAVLLPLVAPLHVVMANIISSVLADLLPVLAFALAKDGRGILSGILASERERMTSVLREAGWRIVDEDREDEWWSVTITRQ
jgi:ribosomal protein L11 methyltransferase